MHCMTLKFRKYYIWKRHHFLQQKCQHTLCVLTDFTNPRLATSISKQEHRMRVPTLGCSCIKKILSRKRGITLSKNGGLPPQLVWVPLLIVNNYSEFQVNIFSNKIYIRKCQSFRTTTPPTTTPGLWQYLDVFFGNSRADNLRLFEVKTNTPGTYNILTKFFRVINCNLK